MKRLYVLLFLVTLVTFTSCKKDSSTPSLNGSWTLIDMKGGMLVSVVPADQTNVVIKFNNNTYEQYVDGRLVYSSNYTLSQAKFPGTDKLMQAITFEDSPQLKVFTELKKNHLILYRGVIAADGTEETYKRN